MSGWVYCEPLEICSRHPVVVDVQFLDGTDVEVVPF